MDQIGTDEVGMNQIGCPKGAPLSLLAAPRFQMDDPHSSIKQHDTVKPQ